MMNGGKVSFAGIADYLKKYKYAVLIAAVGIVLLLLPTGGSGRTEETPEPHSSEFSLDKEEERIANALSAIAGAGRTQVVLTLRAGMQTVYQTNTSQTSDRDGEYDRSEETSETVILSSGSYEQAAVIQEIYPIYEGALVVCEGAGSADVKLNIVSAVSALTGLPSNRITVVKSE